LRVGVTGAGGLLGRTLVPLWREAGADVVAWAHADLDVTDGAAVARAIGQARPEVVVHAAAWTNVDGAESNPRAMAVNETGTKTVAASANAVGATVIYISSDYVFGGAARRPIPPDATLSPVGAYATSKAAGERAVTAAAGAWLIMRTGWSYGPGGRNFVDTMRQAAREARPVQVVDDQVGAPTSVRLMAEALWALLAGRARGIWHVTAAGETSWHGVARAVYEASGADPGLVRRCSSAELNRPAPRPAYSVLDCTRTVAALGAPLPAWDDQVRAYVRTGALPACGLLEAAA